MKLMIAVATLVFLAGAPAGAEVCQKSGENAGAMGIVCSYRCSFGETSVNGGRRGFAR